MSSFDSPSVGFWDHDDDQLFWISRKGKEKLNHTEHEKEETWNTQGLACLPLGMAPLLPALGPQSWEQEQRKLRVLLPCSPGLTNHAAVSPLATDHCFCIWESRNCLTLWDLMEMDIRCSLTPEVLCDSTVHWADSRCCSQQWGSAGQGHPYSFTAYHSVPLCQLVRCY